MSQLRITSILSIGLTVGFVIGFLDIIYSILVDSPSLFKEFALTIPPFTATIVLVTLINWLIASITYLFSLKIKWLKRSYQIWNLLFFLVVLIILDKFQLTNFVFVDIILFKLAAILFVSLLLVQVYNKYIIHSPEQFTKGIIAAIPVLMFKYLFVIWLLTYFEFKNNKALQIFLILYITLASTFLLLSLFILHYKRIASLIINIAVLFILFIFSSIALWFRITPVLKYQYNHDEHKKIKNILFISIDTLRPDFLSCYNPDAPIRTPNIDKLAEDGTIFMNAISPAPWTLPSFASIMTGFSPSVHQAKHHNSSIADAFKTLAEFFFQEGYYTGAIGNNPTLTPQSKIDQGFSEYNFFPKSDFGNSFGASIIYENLFKKHFLFDATTNDLTDLANQWIEKHNKRNFFLWLHYFDPHLAYSPPVQYLPLIPIAPSIGNVFWNCQDIRLGFFTPAEKEKEWIRHLYAAEIKYVDDNLGLLIQKLEKKKIYEESLIILFSDHGEEFWEHDGFEHGHTLYQELLHVPLIIKLPRSLSENNQVPLINTMVPTQSLLPTVLDICSIDYNRQQYPYISLLPLIMGTAEKFHERPIYSTALLYYEDRESVIWEGNKYIRFLYSNKEELYNLIQDPKENRSIISSDSGLKQIAVELLKLQYDQDQQIFNTLEQVNPATIELNKESLEKLKSLGYIK